MTLVARMWGREEIEWQDRAWRLLANAGQMEVEEWSLAGMGAGVLAVVMRKGFREGGWRRVVGGAGVGNLVGVLGYMGWRYGVRGGRR